MIFPRNRYSEDGNDDVLVTLLGPEDMSEAAALVITAPHGGNHEPSYAGNRTEDDLTFCPHPGGCIILKDSYTREISNLIADRVKENYCKVP